MASAATGEEGAARPTEEAASSSGGRRRCSGDSASAPAAAVQQEGAARTLLPVRRGSEEESRQNGSLIFGWLLVAELLVNFDGGGTAAVLDAFTKGCPELKDPAHSAAQGMDYDPNYPCLRTNDQALLGSLPYIGLCLGAPVVGQLLQRYNERKVVLVGLSINCAATLIFAFTLDKLWLFLAKFTVGLSHSGVVIYAPVWVDAFSPPATKTLWLGVTQASIAMGIMLGYGVTGYLVAQGFYYQQAFKLQALGILSTCVVATFIEDESLNVSALRARRGGGAAASCGSVQPSAPSPSAAARMSRRTSIDRIAAASISSFVVCKFEVDDIQASIGRASTQQPAAVTHSFSEGGRGLQQRRSSVSEVRRRSITAAGEAGGAADGRRSGSSSRRRQSADSVLSSGSSQLGEPAALSDKSSCSAAGRAAARGADQRVDARQGSEEAARSPMRPEAAEEDELSTCGQVWMLLNNSIYCSTCCGLCALFFVVTGVQYWTSKYLSVSWQRDKKEVVTVFIAVAGTGPGLGVFLGSATIDRLVGGYSDAAGVRRTSAICTVWGGVAMAAGLIAAFVPPAPPGTAHAGLSFCAVVGAIWVQLLFGGAMLPPVTGVLIASVDEEYRTFASGLANVMYNIFGYAAGTYLPGAIASAACAGASEARVTQVTMQITFLWAVVAFIGILSTALLLRRDGLEWGNSEDEKYQMELSSGVASRQPCPAERGLQPAGGRA